MAVNLFDANYYRSANTDLAAAGITTNEQLLSHFQNYGLNEGRAFSPLVNLNFYRASNGDLASMNNQQAYNHLSNYGVAEGRRFSLFVDLGFYKQANGDLTALNFNNEQLFDHLSNYGVAEGRNFSPFVDLNFYKQVNGDLAAAGFNNKQLLDHLQSYGLNEGRLFNPAFDVTYYREVNADLKAINFNNSQLLDHFQSFGLTEGRISSSAFNVKVYLGNNADLVAAGFGNQQAYRHFLMFGKNEGRPGSDYAGNSLDSARIFPQSTSAIAYTDFVGLGDTKDYYRVSFDGLTNASLKLDGLTDNADAKILDSTGKVIASSLNTGATAETINGTLEAGTYYIEVSSDGANTNYNLTLSTENPLSKAISLGELNGTNSLEKTSTLKVSANDFYRFSVKTESTVNALLDGLNGDANLQVIWDVNKNGLVDKSDAIFSSAQSDMTSEQLKGFLPAGDNYYVRVISNAATPVNYKVTLSTVNQASTMYNYYTGSGTADKGGLFFDSSVGGGTQTAVDNTSKLVSTTYGVAGYSKYDSGAVKLDRNKGYKLKFQVKLNTESHFGDNNGDKLDDNAGFNVTVTSSDGKGIELGFWSNEIWAKSYDSASGSLTHDSSEKATKNTTAMTNYELSVSGDNYQLFAEGSYVLSGKLRDYSGISEKYGLSDYFFLGDNSSSAKADVNIGAISLMTLDTATMAA
ncbi:pre-peptidase C-terminal domain-containing protein [Scytonema sp. NUACC26]|uniref:choice-of-anchor Y domain-containing protein n=1 Tax=Scytonema sp. NUACC26 TaxID=3140176 RepID=UPI0034DC625F